MLTELTIRNVVLIDRLALELEDGLSALTGETGAGKSILLDSLGLAMGARANPGLVRKGEEKATVAARFDLPSTHHVFCLLKDQDIECDDGDLVLRRILSAEGKSRAYINDQSVSAGTLRSVAQQLIEVHGQFDTHGLLDPKTHCALLDTYAGLEEQVEALGALWRDWRNAVRGYETARDTAAAARAEEAYLRESLEDLDALAPERGEEEALAEKRAFLMSREQIVEALQTAQASLSSGTEDGLNAAWRAIENVADKGGERFSALLDIFGRMSEDLRDAEGLLSSIGADMDAPDAPLEDIDERLYALRQQARKHGCTVDDLLKVQENFRTKLSLVENTDEALDRLEKAVQQARTAYVDQARTLHDHRLQSAARLDQCVMAELPPLKLEKARFETSVQELDEERWNASGLSHVQFMVATHPGAAAGPMNKIASGGELARFTLSLKVVMAGKGSGPQTMIFDEVDTGIGGATADAVGERLARLGQDRQVLVVTHSPQVAAKARYHYTVSKAEASGVVTTSVEPLNSSEERRNEIARMLSGASVTEEAQAAAAKLMEAAA